MMDGIDFVIPVPWATTESNSGSEEEANIREGLHQDRQREDELLELPLVGGYLE
jgi:hypothetical protein